MPAHQDERRLDIALAQHLEQRNSAHPRHHHVAKNERDWYCGQARRIGQQHKGLGAVWGFLYVVSDAGKQFYERSTEVCLIFHDQDILALPTRQVRQGRRVSRS